MKPALIQSGPFQVNTWIVPLAGSRVLVIDPAACSLSRDETAILSYLNENRLEPAGIFLTHGHFDHITGVRILKDAFPECKIAVHEKDAAMCGSRAAETQGAILGAMGLSYLASAIENLPDADSLFSGGETLDAVFPPRADDDETLRTALGREVHFESAGARTAEGGGSDGFGIAAALLTVLFWLFVFSSLSSRRRRGGLLPWLLLWGVFGGSGRNS